MGQYKITNSNIVSFEMNVRLEYKDCEMILKKFDNLYKIDGTIISNKGYIVEYGSPFVAEKNIYPNLLNYINNVISEDIETVYKRLINKKNFTDQVRSS